MNFFSIVIPTYEMHGLGSNLLDYSLSKLSTQTFKDFEVVVSDHSLDEKVFDVCNNWSSILKIKYIKFPNNIGNSSANLNNGIKNSTGEWIKVLFQDDFIYSDYSLENIYRSIKSQSNIIWLVTACEHSYDGYSFYRPFYPKWNDNIYLGNNTISSPSVLCFKNIKGLFFDERLINLMDVDFYKMMFDSYGEPFYLNVICVVNRTWHGQLSMSISNELNKKEIVIVSEKYNNLDDSNGNI